jgi:hypothetical protein
MPANVMRREDIEQPSRLLLDVTRISACPLWANSGRRKHRCQLGRIADIKRGHQAIRRHIEDNNSEKFVRAQMYSVTNRSVATVADIRLLLRDKTFPIRVATKTKIAETAMFANSSATNQWTVAGFFL